MARYFRSKHLISDFALNPEFIEWHDCVLLKDGFDEKLLRGFKPGDPTKSVESALNRRHVTDLFINPPTAAPAELLWEAGVMVRDTWTTILKTKFPDRKFELYFEFALPIADITFYQVTDESALRKCEAVTHTYEIRN